MKCASLGILETYKQLNLFTSRALETENLKAVWKSGALWVLWSLSIDPLQACELEVNGSRISNLGRRWGRGGRWVCWRGAGRRQTGFESEPGSAEPGRRAAQDADCLPPSTELQRLEHSFKLWIIPGYFFTYFYKKRRLYLEWFANIL